MGRTLYNWFPTRDALVEAVFADRVATVADLAERALAMDDAWDGFVVFLTGVCELQGADLGYNDLAARTAPVDWRSWVRPDAGNPRPRSAIRGVAARHHPRRHGLRALGRGGDHQGHPQGSAGSLATTSRPDLDGLRATTAHPLPTPPMSTEQTRAALRKC